MKPIALIFLSALLSLSFAQTMIPRLIISDHGKESMAKLTDLSVEVTVIGAIARTTYDMTFFNPATSVREGRFQLPLAEGQKCVGFGLEVNGEMRDGVVVEKEKGEIVFEAIVRKGIDPGLLEKTEGNIYKARIYPIPANGSKRIRITTETELTGDSRGLKYSLPLDTSNSFKRFSVSVKSVSDTRKPISEESSESLLFKEFKSAWCADTVFQNYRPKGALQFIIPENIGAKTAITGTKDGSRFFYVRTKIDAKTTPRSWGDTVTLLWDRSGSAGFSQTESVREILKSVLKKENGISVIELVSFSRVAEKPIYFESSPEGVQKLLTQISQIPYDGATTFAAIDLRKYKGSDAILVSDGLNTLGNDSIETGGISISVITGGVRANHQRLQMISHNSGGSYVNLAQMSSAEGIKFLNSTPIHCMGQKVVGGEIREVYSNISPETGVFTMAGKLSGNETTITLTFGSSKKSITTITIPLIGSKDDTLMGENISRLWGQKKLENLIVFGESRRSEIIELAKKYSLVTDYTSLIVLENVEDYLQYEITPPLSLQAEYFAQLKEIKQMREINKESSLEEILSKLEERNSWWNQKFGGKGCFKGEDERDDRFSSLQREYSAEAVSADGYSEDAYAMDSSPMPLEMSRGFSGGSGGVSNKQAEMSSVGSSNESERYEESRPSTSISIKEWTPNAAYADQIRKAADPFAAYLSAKKEYGASPAFYLDAAHIFNELGKREIAITILSNIAEMDVENHELLRILGYRLIQYGEYNLAESLFRRVAVLRAFEPQSWRDLGLILESTKKYQEAAEMLYRVAIGTWDSRFSDINIIALNELNSLLKRYSNQIDESSFDSRLLKNLPVEIRVVLSWDADNSDIDLWVIDPNGEKCFYSHPRTCIGGYMSDDFTEGYGPEEFILKNPIPGTYTVKANYYGSHQQYLTGDVTLKMSLQRNFGTEMQKTEETMVRLENEREEVEVGTFVVGAKSGK